MLTLNNPVVLSNPGDVLEDVILSGITGVAVVVKAPSCMVRKVTINGCLLSAIMLEDGADNCTIQGCQITNYNSSNTNGHAAIFAYPTGKIRNLTISHCIIGSGNGNAVRLTNCVGFEVFRNQLWNTTGLSSEGLTLNGSCEWGSIWANIIENTWTDGALVWGGPHQCITFKNNWIRNSGQAKDGTHPAIGIQPNGTTLSGIVIQDNSFYDDQATPTQNCGVMTYGAGAIRCGRVINNLQWGCAYDKVWTPANGSTIVFEDWVSQ